MRANNVVNFTTLFAGFVDQKDFVKIRLIIVRIS